MSASSGSSGPPSGIYFTANSQGELPLFKLDVAAKKVDKIAAQQGVQVTSFSLARDGAIAVTRSGFRHPADVFVGAPGAPPNRHVTDVNRQLLSERALAPVETINTRRTTAWISKDGW